MTTVGEFLNKTKGLIKQSQPANQTESTNNDLNEFVDQNPGTVNLLNKGVGLINYIVPGYGDKLMGDVAHSTQPQIIYTGKDAPASGPERYKYLANKIYGDADHPENNPYLNYFDTIGDDYTDSDFLNHLQSVMKSNPSIGAMVMRNAMNGDSTFADLLTNQARLAVKTDPEGARNCAKGAQYLYQQRGTLGKTLAGPEVQGNIMSKQFTDEFDRQRKLHQSGRYGVVNQWGSPYLFNRWDKDTEAANYAQYTEDYNNKIFNPLVADKRLEHNFWGKLQDPAIRNAVRYALPWAGYGLPLAAGASVFGNNNLWVPVGLGMLGSGAYGYGVGNGYFPQNETLDNAVGTANKPLAWAGGKVLPSGFPMQQAFVDPVTPKTKATTPQKQETTQQQTMPQTTPQASTNPYTFQNKTWQPYQIS